VSQHKIQKFILIEMITISATKEILAAASSLYQKNLCWWRAAVTMGCL